LCAATLLQNRENDDGGAQFERLWAVRVAYALSTALISICPQVSQGEAYSAIMGTVTRNLGPRDAGAMTRIARALGAAETGAQEKAPAWIASHFEAQYQSIGMPTRLSALDVDRAVFPRLIEHSLKNFNADPKQEFAKEPQTLEAVLNAAW
jgi:alcohol dehydrogenase class IV